MRTVIAAVLLAAGALFGRSRCLHFPPAVWIIPSTSLRFLHLRGRLSMRYPDDDDDRYDRYANDDDLEYRRPRRRKKRPHSELGIASCVLAVLAGFVVFLTLVVAGVITAREGDLNEDDPRTMGVGCAMFTGAGLALV